MLIYVQTQIVETTFLSRAQREHLCEDMIVLFKKSYVTHRLVSNLQYRRKRDYVAFIEGFTVSFLCVSHCNRCYVFSCISSINLFHISRQRNPFAPYEHWYNIFVTICQLTSYSSSYR